MLFRSGHIPSHPRLLSFLDFLLSLHSAPESSAVLLRVLLSILKMRTETDKLQACLSEENQGDENASISDSVWNEDEWGYARILQIISTRFASFFASAAFLASAAARSAAILFLTSCLPVLNMWVRCIRAGQA